MSKLTATKIEVRRSIWGNPENDDIAGEKSQFRQLMMVCWIVNVITVYNNYLGLRATRHR
jgi:hypothetical protein